MEKSKVYFTDLRTKPGMNLLDKVEALIKKAGVEEIDF
ncbi:MAG TPA: 4Fe-4S ferredoxin, partial [Clostridiaceae bacterium]